MKDDWDLVSSPAEEEAWDAVSTPAQQALSGQLRRERLREQPTPEPRQSSRPDTLLTAKQDTAAAPPSPPSQNASAFLSVVRGHISMSFLIRLGLFIVVIVGLFAAGHFGLFRVGVNSVVITSATATAQTGAVAPANATATAQTAGAAATLQQLYTRATSGTPFINDPLSNNNMGYAWGVLTLSFGGTCFFTGTDYHISIPNSGYYWMWCAGRNIYLNNFAFQVQMSMAKPGDGGIVFGYTPNGFYRMDIGSAGNYTLLQYTQNNNQTQTLASGSNLAINSGLNQANVITLIVYNGNLYFYANNQFVVSAGLSAYGLTYTTGTFGFAAQNFGQPTEVVYTNLKVWEL